MARGGVRRGAGRPRGSGKGRTASAALNLRISVERKEKLQEYCAAKNTTLTAVANEWLDSLEEAGSAAALQRACDEYHAVLDDIARAVLGADYAELLKRERTEIVEVPKITDSYVLELQVHAKFCYEQLLAAERSHSELITGRILSAHAALVDQLYWLERALLGYESSPSKTESATLASALATQDFTA